LSYSLLLLLFIIVAVGDGVVVVIVVITVVVIFVVLSVCSGVAVVVAVFVAVAVVDNVVVTIVAVVIPLIQVTLIHSFFGSFIQYGCSDNTLSNDIRITITGRSSILQVSFPIFIALSWNTDGGVTTCHSVREL